MHAYSLDNPLFDPRQTQEDVRRAGTKALLVNPSDDAYLIDMIKTENPSVKAIAYNCLIVPIFDNLSVCTTRRWFHYLKRNGFNKGIYNNPSHPNAQLNRSFELACGCLGVHPAIVSKGNRFYAATFFKSGRWVDALRETNLFDDVMNRLRGSLFSPVLKIVDVSIESERFAELVNRYNLVRPTGAPGDNEIVHAVVFDLEVLYDLKELLSPQPPSS